MFKMRIDLLEPWKQAIKKAGFYKLHSCSMCGYECGWLFVEDALFYDSGCYCTRGSNLRAIGDSELDFYLEPSHGHISNIEKFIEENKSCEHIPEWANKIPGWHHGPESEVMCQICKVELQAVWSEKK